RHLLICSVRKSSLLPCLTYTTREGIPRFCLPGTRGERGRCAYGRPNSPWTTAPAYPSDGSHTWHCDQWRLGTQRRPRPHVSQIHDSLRDVGSVDRIAAPCSPLL